MSDWRYIKGYGKRYKISNDGQIWSNISKVFLTPIRSKSGYLRVHLSNGKEINTHSIHRLVALTFIPNPLNKPTVNHINEDKSDNRVANLEWMTNAEQNIHGTRIKRAMAHTNWKARSSKIDYYTIAKKHDYSRQDMCNRKKTFVYRNGDLVGIYDTLKQAAESLFVNYSKASMVANGKRKSTGGYVFCFEDYDAKKR